MYIVSGSARPRERRPGRTKTRESLEGAQKLHLLSPIVAMCRITIKSFAWRRHRHRAPARRSNPSNLLYPTLSTCTYLEAMGGMQRSLLVVKKADTISAYASLQTLHFPAFKETWITPENTPGTLQDPRDEEGGLDSSSSLPGLSPAPLEHILIRIPCCLCHHSYQV